LQLSDLLVWPERFSQASYSVSPRAIVQVGGELEPRSEGKQSDVARLLDRKAKAALMPCAYTGQTARNNLAALGDKTLQQTDVAVRDRIDLLGAELAHLFAPEEFAAARATRSCAARTWRAGTGARAGVTAAWAGCGCVLLS
jgi:hypothetical protein